MKSSSIDRRQFLTSVASSAAVLGAGASNVFAAAQPRRIRIGFLGASHSHAEGKLRVVQASSEYELVGACEESPEARRRCEQLGVKLMAQDELLDRCAVIAVESPVRDHAAHAMAALKAGKHVHLEKAPAANFEDVKQIVALARDRKLLLQTGYMWRYHPGFKAIFEAVRQGWLGDVVMVRATMTKTLSPEARKEWAEFKGGSMFELGGHLIDPIVRLMGRPKSIQPTLRHHGKHDDDLKDNNVVVFEFDRALAVLTDTALQPTKAPERSFEVVGTRGSAMLRSIEPPVFSIELSEAAGSYRKGLQTVPLPDYRRYEGDFVELAAAVRGERALTAALDEELLVQECLLRASGML